MLFGDGSMCVPVACSQHSGWQPNLGPDDLKSSAVTTPPSCVFQKGKGI